MRLLRYIYRLAVLVWLSVGVVPTSLAVDYRTDLLATIADKVVLTSADTPSFHGYSLNVISEDGRITHIGYQLFTSNQCELFGATVCNFVERYLLELDIPIKSHLSRTERTHIDHVVIEGNTSPMELSGDTAIAVKMELTDGKIYSVRWCRNENTVYRISFPVEYDLLVGTDMDERERRLSEELKRTKTDSVTQEMPLTSQLHKAWQENYYTLEGGTYLIDELKADLYFQNDNNGQLRPVFTSEYPAESLANLFTSLYIEGDFTIDIQLRKYGFKTERILVPLRQWITFCLQEGCKPYFGIIKLEEHTAQCELIMYNASMGYNHVMKLYFPLNAISTRQGTIEARLTPYVTTSRVKNIFEDDQRK